MTSGRWLYIDVVNPQPFVDNLSLSCEIRSISLLLQKGKLILELSKSLSTTIAEIYLALVTATYNLQRVLSFNLFSFEDNKSDKIFAWEKLSKCQPSFL